MTFLCGMQMRQAVFFSLLIFGISFPGTSNVKAELRSSQARKAITRMPGFELTNGAVRVRTISPTSATTAEVAAEIRNVFNFQKDQQGRWRIAELRTGPSHWERISLISAALSAEAAADGCAASDPPFKDASAIDPGAKRVRCLLGSLLGVEVPSDAVRIQSISPMAIPFASQPSAVVVTWIRVDARIVNEQKTGWRVAELRVGNREWVKLQPLVDTLNREKLKKAQTEMQMIARALQQFRKDRGFYVVSDNQAAVVDHLSPRYLPQVIRLDPWHQPYRYKGDANRFVLSSTGPDGKEQTADDIVINGISPGSQ